MSPQDSKIYILHCPLIQRTPKSMLLFNVQKKEFWCLDGMLSVNYFSKLEEFTIS